MSFHVDSSDDESFKSAESNPSLDDDPVAKSLGSVLANNCFVNYRKNFNVCHINAQSIPSHYTDLLEAFDSPLIHAVLISESWLKPSLRSNSYALPNYSLVRNDRTGKPGGGVAIYIKSNISYKIALKSPSAYNADAEYLFLEVDFGVKIILGVVYCPPGVNYFSSLECALESLMADHTHFLIMGDFNTCTLAQSPRLSKLRHITDSVNLYMLHLLATHHTSSSDTLLDLIFTSHTDLIAAHGQLAAPGFSHHDLIFTSFKIKTPKPKPVIMFQRNFSRLDTDALNSDAALINWSEIENFNTVDDKVEFLNKTILKLFDKHSPVHPVKIKHRPSPWFNDSIKRAMSKRDRAFRKFKNNRSDENWTMYKTLRNSCNKLVRNTKRRHIADQVKSSTPAGLWNFLRSLGLAKSKQKDTSITIDLNVLNNYFTTNSNLSSDVKQSTLTFINSIPTPNCDYFNFSPVSIDRVHKIILSLKSKAVGCDDIGRIMIMHILTHLLPAITDIINTSFSSSVFPDQWRKAYIIPLPKVPSPTLPSHYRPISILPFLSKVLEAEVHRQVTIHLRAGNLHNPFQSGFRTGHSTATALLKVTEDIRRNMGNTLITVMVLIDFSNAFNAVDHDLLIAVLSRLNFSPSSVTWFSSYLENRRQAARAGQKSSDWLESDTGVPQGGILSPLLFSLFINLLPSNFSCSYHMYADDLQIYRASSSDYLSHTLVALNEDLSSLKTWSSNFGIKVNPDKCQAIVIGSSRQLAKVNFHLLPNLTYNGVTIPLSPSVKDLGVIIDSNLNWSDHIKELSRKFYSSLHSILRLKNFLPVKTKILLVNALLLPIIDYADISFVDLNAELLNKLDRLLNTCIRFIYGLRKYDHVSTYRAKLKWLPIRERREARFLCLLYSVLFDENSPHYLKELFQYLGVSHDHALRSQDNRVLAFPQHSTAFVGNSFSVVSVDLWNTLPLELKTASSRESFKIKVRKYFLKKVHGIT